MQVGSFKASRESLAGGCQTAIVTTGMRRNFIECARFIGLDTARLVRHHQSIFTGLPYQISHAAWSAGKKTLGLVPPDSDWETYPRWQISANDDFERSASESE